jgi:transposase
MQTQSNVLSFKGQNIFVGIDSHLKSWKVTVIVEKREFKTYTQPPEPVVLVDYLKRNFPGGNYLSAYEASFSGFWSHYELNKLGVKNIVVNPADIPTTDKEKKQKEDKRDSRKIARALMNNELEPIYVMGQLALEDRKFIRMRYTLSKELTRIKNRIKSDLYFFGKKYPPEFEKSGSHWSRRFIKWLEEIKFEERSGNLSFGILIRQAKNLRQEILEVTKEIRNLSKTEKYAIDVKLLMGIPGIGLLTAMLILTELDTITRFTNLDNLCSYIGIVPMTSSSGEKEKTGDITVRCNNLLRMAIVESSWVASRTDPALLMCFNQYVQKMEPNKAVIKIARKLINRIRYVLKNKKEYVYAVVK